MTVVVKICGLTRPEDAEAAVEAGCDWVGLNFWPHSPRFVSASRAADIVAAVPGAVTKVGVFVNQSVPHVNETALRLGLDLVQLHGDEDPTYCRLLGRPYVRALRLSCEDDLRGLEGYGTDLFLVDAPSAGYGGSGKVGDWSLARLARAPDRRILLAGGLTADNVAQAVREARPFGVDVASGVERAAGVKDRDKMRRFVAAAKGGFP